LVVHAQADHSEPFVNLSQVPIKPVANELGLKIHQLDTFTRWAPPTPVHLVVAVSFGLLVPGRILKNATYGGVNVHPSMLPDLRGPAPMIHTLLKRRQYTGVTLQTMHPKSFDNGAILDQTLAPGIGVPQGCTPDHLLKLLAPIGAQMLCNGIENGSFVQPTPLDALDSAETQAIDHAPKISSADRRINWENWTADEIILRDRVLGRLWDMETHARCSGYDKRIVFNGPWEKVASGASRPGTPIVVPGERRIGITTQDGYTVIPSAATIDGGKRGTGLQALLAHLTAVD
jgi:methionyl-tRNA formyltransferase